MSSIFLPEEVVREDRRRQLGLAQLEAATTPSPDVAAEMRRDARKRGVPFVPTEVVSKESKPFDPAWADLVDVTPVSTMLADPVKAPLAKDVVKELVDLAGAAKEGLPTNDIQRGWESERLTDIDFKIAIGIATTDDYVRKAQLETRELLAPQVLGLGESILHGIPQQLPQFAGQAGAALVGGAAGAATGALAGPGGALAGGAVGARAATAAYSVTRGIGQVYRALANNAGIPHSVASPLALIAGTLIGGVDALSFGVFAQIPGIRKVAGVLAGKVTPDEFVKAAQAAVRNPRFKELTKSVLAEGGGEVLQEWMEILSVHLGAKIQPGEYRLPTFAEGVDRSIVAGTIGGIYGGAGNTVSNFLGRAVTPEAKLERIYEATDPAKLKLQDRAPDILHEVAAKSAEEGAVKVFTYELKDLQTLFQGSGKTQEWVRQTMPEVARSMDEAVRTGGRVTVPFADFVTYIRPLDTSKTLLQKTAINDEAAPDEAQAVRKEVEAAKQTFAFPAVSEAGPEGGVAQIQADIQAKLEATGMDPEGALARGQMIATGISVLTRKINAARPDGPKLDPWEVYKSAPLDITRANVLPALLGGDLALFQRLAKVSPEMVKVERVAQGVTRLTFPGTPLYLDVVPDEVEGQLVFTGHLGPTHDEGLRQGLKKSIGGQGVSTALYLRILALAQAEGVGFASAEKYAQMDVTQKMYPRLMELGLPFKETSHPDPEWRRYYITAEDLKNFDIEKAWEAARLRSTAFVEALSEEEVMRGLGPLAFLAQKIKDDIRGFLRFDPKKRDYFELVLTGKANLSTFLHESGHYLLELQRKYADEVPEIAADLRVLEDWAGVAPGTEWTVDALEKFARGFEAYLMEGKAPSSALEQIFYRFKALLIHVYRTLTNLGVELTDEVRGVMDRILATKEEIDARRVEMGYFPSKALADEIDSDPGRQAYIRAYEQAAQIAEGRAERAAIAELRAEKTAEYKTIRAAVEAEVHESPVYRLRRFLENGEHPEPAYAGKKLDLQAVKDMKLSRAAMNRLAPLLTVGGIDPTEAVGPYFGFKNVSEALTDVAMAPAETTEVQRQVKARMSEQYPGYGMRKDWLEATALERLHDRDAVAHAIEVEQMALFRRAGLTPPISPAKVARITAEELTLAKPVKDLHPNQYRIAERKAWREAMKALAAKDFKAAAEWTRRRLLNAEMFAATSEAVRAQKKAFAFVNSFTDLDKQARLGKADPKLRDMAKALIQGLGLEARDATPPLVETLAAFQKPYEAAEIESPLAPVVEQFTGFVNRSWNTLTYAEVLNLYDALKNIQHVAGKAGEILAGARRIALEDAAAKGMAALQASGLYERLGDAGETRSFARKLRSEASKVESQLIDMDGGKPGFWHRLFFRSAEAGQFDFDKRHEDRIKMIRALNKKHRPEDWQKLAQRKVDFLGRQMTHLELFAVILNLGTEINRFKLLAGAEARGWRGWTFDSVIRRLHEIFPDTEGKNVWTWAQALLDYISDAKTWEEVSDVTEKMYGLRPTKQQALAVPLPNGKQIPGGYYPLMRDPNAPPMAGDELDALQQTVEAMGGTFSPRNLFVSHGFTHERTGKIYPLLLDPQVLTAHLYEVDHYIANAQGVLDRYRLLNHKGIRDLIVRSLGREVYEDFIDWNKYIAQNGRRVSQARLQIDWLVTRAIWGNAIVTMGGSLLSGVNQVVNGIPATLARLGPEGWPSFFRALGEFASHPFRLWEDVAKESGEMAAATFKPDRDLRIIVDESISGASRWESARSRLASVTMTPIIFFQKAINIVTWRAALIVAKKKGLSHADAVAYANSEVRQSQSTAGNKDMTAWQRNPNPLLRMLTTLGSYQFTLNDLIMPRRLTPEQLKGAMVRMIILVLTGAVTKAMMDLAFPKLEEEDKKRRKGAAKGLEQWDDTGMAVRLFESFLDNGVASVPIAGRPAAALLYGREARWGPGMEQTLNRLVRGAERLAEKGEMSKPEFKAALEAVGIVAGVPTRHVVFGPMEFLYEYVNGNVEEGVWPLMQEALLVRPGQKGER